MPCMGTIERLMIEAMARHPEGLTPEEALDAIVSPDRPKLRLRPAYKYCFDRLNSRRMVDWVAGTNAGFHAPNDGVLRFRPSEKAMAELRRSIDAQLKPDGEK